MTISQEAPELIQYSCERCKRRFQLPPSSQKLGIRGSLRGLTSGIGRTIRLHQGLGESVGTVRRELLAKKDDEAYQAFVLSFRFCHECRQFVCNDCWSKSRGSCLTCAGKPMTSPVRPKVHLGAAVPDIPRPIVAATPLRKGHVRRNFGLVAMSLAIVLLSIEGGVLLLNAATGPNLSANQTNGTPGNGPTAPTSLTQTNTPGSTAAIVAVSSDTPTDTGTAGPTPTLALGATPEPPGATHRPGVTPHPTVTPVGQTPAPTPVGQTPGPTPPPTPAPTPPPTDTPTPTLPPTPTPTPTPTLTITASSGSMVYGAGVPTINPSYSGLVNGDTGPATLPICTTTAQSSSPVGSYPSSCTGAADPNYNIVYVQGSVGVTRAPLSITASSPTIVVNDAIPAISPIYGGLVNGDVATSTPPACSSPTADNTTVGQYPTVCSGASDPNYTISYFGGLLTVNP